MPRTFTEEEMLDAMVRTLGYERADAQTAERISHLRNTMEEVHRRQPPRQNRDSQDLFYMLHGMASLVNNSLSEPMLEGFNGNELTVLEEYLTAAVNKVRNSIMDRRALLGTSPPASLPAIAASILRDAGNPSDYIHPSVHVMSNDEATPTPNSQPVPDEEET